MNREGNCFKSYIFSEWEVYHISIRNYCDSGFPHLVLLQPLLLENIYIEEDKDEVLIK